MQGIGGAGGNAAGPSPAIAARIPVRELRAMLERGGGGAAKSQRDD
jgi:hypothetical protein